MLTTIVDFLHKTSQELNNLNYSCVLDETEHEISFEAKGIKYILRILYSENENNLPYSLYNMTIFVKFDGATYLYNLSERLPTNTAEDIVDIKIIIDNVIKKDNFKIEKERFLIFWNKTYLSIKSEEGQISLLRTK